MICNKRMMKDLRQVVSQYVKKNVDGFTIVLNQKELDAVQDGSFI